MYPTVQLSGICSNLTSSVILTAKIQIILILKISFEGLLQKNKVFAGLKEIQSCAVAKTISMCQSQNIWTKNNISK
jgi:hypothetical protein